jgi:hypothetical protein
MTMSELTRKTVVAVRFNPGAQVMHLVLDDWSIYSANASDILSLAASKGCSPQCSVAVFDGEKLVGLEPLDE